MMNGLLSRLEIALAAIKRRVGDSRQQSVDLSAFELLTSCFGDYGLTVAYAGLFAPEITMRGDVPFARFSPEDESFGAALDRFHVDLLHHESAESRHDPAVLRAIGLALSQFWSRQLDAAGIAGHFEYDDSEGYDVVYVPEQAG